MPEDLRGTARRHRRRDHQQLGFPYGAHVCEVEIDPQTGALELVRYTAVDDVGRAINPMVVHGQTHGGAAQGIGQALWEHAAPTMRRVNCCRRRSWITPCRAPTSCRRSPPTSAEVLTPTNRLGVRGAGEGGTTGALGAVVNAVVDALAEFGVTHIEMPVTPERIWRAIHASQIIARIANNVALNKGATMPDILTKQDGRSCASP